jgi:hypothetical protein
MSCGLHDPRVGISKGKTIMTFQSHTLNCNIPYSEAVPYP